VFTRMAVVIDGYLTEAKLATALQEIAREHWAGGQVALAGSRRRWDMALKQSGSLVLVEYDGDEHYRDALKIKADREKDQLAQANRMRMVRIPYWVQLDNVTAQHYFGLSVEIQQNFPHGFITTKLFPASFCELGVQRFNRELAYLPLPSWETFAGHSGQRAFTCRSQKLIFRRKKRSLLYSLAPNWLTRPHCENNGTRAPCCLAAQHFRTSQT